jgi:hypothetical protein
VLAWQGWIFTYRETLPSTGDRALEVLRSRLSRPDGRHVITEHDFGSQFHTRHRRGRLALHTAATLTEVTSERLDLADAEVFPAHLLADPKTGDFYSRRLERFAERNVVTIEPRPFRAWGPALVVLIHPWRLVTETPGLWSRSPQDPLTYTTSLPTPVSVRHRYSVVFTPPRRTRVSHLQREHEPLTYVGFRGPRKQMPLTTSRFVPTEEIELILGKAPPADQIPLTVRTWKPSRKARSQRSPG